MKYKCLTFEQRYIQGKVGIGEQPSIVEEKNRFGDFEGDTITGKNHKGAIMTLNDKETKIMFLQKLDWKESESLANAVIRSLSPYKSMKILFLILFEYLVNLQKKTPQCHNLR